jgi:hypothetical protein
MWLAPGQTNGVDNPVLRIVTFGDDGIIDDPYSLAYAIYDLTSEDNFATPSEVVGRTDVDLDTEKLALGEFAPTWELDSDQATGLYQIRWFVKFTEDSTEVEYRQNFQVAAFAAGVWDYPLISVLDMRNEGFTASTLSDSRVYQAVRMATRRIEQLTDNIFGARRMELKLDGDGSSVLNLPFPIIALESVVATFIGVTTTLDVSELGYKVYNRHLKGMLNPDDRKWPHIEVIPKGLPGYRYNANWEASLDDRWRFPKGPQNITVKGVFGYTDPDGSPMGGVPDEIKWATARLAQRFLPKQSSPAVSELERAGQITSETTRDQSYSIGQKLQMSAPLTGDPFLDEVLLRYRRTFASRAS